MLCRERQFRPRAVDCAIVRHSPAFMATAASAAGAFTAWVPGQLPPLPPSEERRVKLTVRAKWPHISTRLADHAKVALTVRGAVLQVEGVRDEVLTGMVLRHLEYVAMPAQDLLLDELTFLLAILVGPDRATKLLRPLLSMLEEGIEVSWYEERLRRKYGG